MCINPSESCPEPFPEELNWCECEQVVSFVDPGFKVWLKRLLFNECVLVQSSSKTV